MSETKLRQRPGFKIAEFIMKAASFLFSGRQYFFAGFGKFVIFLSEAGNDPAAARRHAFAKFLVIAGTGGALFGGQLLGKSGHRCTENKCDEEYTQHPNAPLRCVSLAKPAAPLYQIAFLLDRLRRTIDDATFFLLVL